MAAGRPDAEVLGIDPSPRRARTCSENAARLGLANARFVTADAAALPLADGSVDLVTAAASLEEASAPEAVFAELRRVLRPGGALRASYQNWRLPAPELESVLLWDGVDAAAQPIRLYTYVRRLQDPPLERRYTLELPAEGEAARLHQQALEAAALGRRAYGETLLAGAGASSLGLELLERLAPHARRSTVVELRRWTTEWLRGALRARGLHRRARDHAPRRTGAPPRARADRRLPGRQRRRARRPQGARGQLRLLDGADRRGGRHAAGHGNDRGRRARSARAR